MNTKNTFFSFAVYLAAIVVSIWGGAVYAGSSVHANWELVYEMIQQVTL